MLEPRQRSNLNPDDLTSRDEQEQSSSQGHLELQALSERVGPVIVDGNAIATILSEERVGSPTHLLQLLSRIERDYSEALGALRQVLRPGECLTSFQLEPVEEITREQFGALVELHIQRIQSSPQLPSFSKSLKLRPDTEVDGDTLGFLPPTSTVTLQNIEVLSTAATLCKRLLSSAEVTISGQSTSSDSHWPSREEALSLFASILFRRAALGNTVHLPNIPYWLRQLDQTSLSDSLSSQTTSKPTGSHRSVPSHMNKHYRSA